MHRRLARALFVVAALTGLHCGGASTSVNPIDVGTADGASGGDVIVEDTPDTGKPLAPTTLRSFETTAEGVGDACKLPDFTKAGNVLVEAKTTWATLEPEVKAAGASDALLQTIDNALAALATEIPASKQKECETDANVVTLAVPNLFDLYSWPVPSDALRGDGVFRQLQIDGEYSDWTRTASDLTMTKDVWARLKPPTSVRAPTRPDLPGSSTVVADIDKAIADCDTAIRAKDAVGLQAAAQRGLDAIDVVESIFE